MGFALQYCCPNWQLWDFKGFCQVPTETWQRRTRTGAVTISGQVLDLLIQVHSPERFHPCKPYQLQINMRCAAVSQSWILVTSSWWDPTWKTQYVKGKRSFLCSFVRLPMPSLELLLLYMGLWTIDLAEDSLYLISKSNGTGSWLLESAGW